MGDKKRLSMARPCRVIAGTFDRRTNHGSTHRGGTLSQAVTRVTFVLLCLSLTLACSQHYKEGADAPAKRPPKTALPAGHPQVSDGSQNKSKGTEEGKTVKGVIRLSPDLAGKVSPNAYLYILARERPGGGPPYAFKMMRVPEFPYEFTLSQSDVAQMFGEGIVLEEIPEMYLVAKIDQDGRVGPVQPGDMEGACADNPIVAGPLEREVVIDRIH